MDKMERELAEFERLFTFSTRIVKLAAYAEYFFDFGVRITKLQCDRNGLHLTEKYVGEKLRTEAKKGPGAKWVLPMHVTLSGELRENEFEEAEWDLCLALVDRRNRTVAHPLENDSKTDNTHEDDLKIVDQFDYQTVLDELEGINKEEVDEDTRKALRHIITEYDLVRGWN